MQKNEKTEVLTSIRLPFWLWKKLKQQAIDERTTLNEILVKTLASTEDALSD